jgi:hypothetical protein
MAKKAKSHRELIDTVVNHLPGGVCLYLAFESSR